MNTYFGITWKNQEHKLKTWKVPKITSGGGKKVRLSHQKREKRKLSWGTYFMCWKYILPLPNGRPIPGADSQGGTQRWPAGLQLGQSLVLVPNFWQFGFGAKHAPRYPVRRLQFVEGRWPGCSVWMWRGSGVSAEELLVSLKRCEEHKIKEQLWEGCSCSTEHTAPCAEQTRA